MLAEKKEWQGHRGQVLDSVRGFEVLECEPCGFKHIVPIPTPEELDAVCSQEYYSIEKPLYVERQREDLAWSAVPREAQGIRSEHGQGRHEGLEAQSVRRIGVNGKRA